MPTAATLAQRDLENLLDSLNSSPSNYSVIDEMGMRPSLDSLRAINAGRFETAVTR